MSAVEPEALFVSWPAGAISLEFCDPPDTHLRMDSQILVDVRKESWSPTVLM